MYLQGRLASKIVAFLWMVILNMLPACDMVSSTSSDSQGGESNRESTVQVGVNLDGSTYSASVVNATSTLQISIADGSALSGTSLEIPPGTLSSATKITITEGAPLVNDENTSQVGKGVTAAGKAVIVSSSAFEDPLAPMPLTLSLGVALGLQAPTAEVGILYMAVLYGEKFQIILGIIPSEQVQRRGNSVQFGAPFFGSYQPVYLPAEANKEFRIIIDQDIISASGEVMIVDGGDKQPPVAGGEGKIELLALDHRSATIGFEIASDNFSETYNLSYLAYVSSTDRMSTLQEVEAAMPIGDFRRKITAITIPDLTYAQTYFVNIVVRDEMSNKAIYQRQSFTTPTPNFGPTIVSTQPSTENVLTHYRDTLNFSVNAKDLNQDTLTYQWQINGTTSNRFSANGSSAVFTPNLDFAGTNIVDVAISDGTNVVNHRWQVKVHAFNPGCDGLQPGHICTLVGPVDLGDQSEPAQDGSVVRMNPRYIALDTEGNPFISDSELKVVWFYNRSGSAVTRLGRNVPAGKLLIIAGSGASGVGTNGDDALNFALGGANGIAYDATRDALYVALESEHVVVRIGSDGTANTIFGRGDTINSIAWNHDDIVGTTSVCSFPNGLAVDSGTDTLYIACRGSYAIKRAQPASAAVGSVLSRIVIGGVNGSGLTVFESIEGTLGRAGTARTPAPRSVRLGRDGNLYFTQASNCRFRVANLGGSAATYFSSAVNVASQQTATLSGTGSCSMTLGAASYNAFMIGDAQDVEIAYDESSNIRGFFLSHGNYHRISFLNQSGSSMTFGDSIVGTHSAATIFGSGAYGYNGNSLSGRLTRLNFPLGLAVAGDSLMVGDNFNRRVRSLDLSADNGAVDTVVGSGKGIRGFSGDLPQAADAAEITSPYGIGIIGRELFFADQGNYRIRSVNLDSGLIRTAIGIGQGDGEDGGAFATYLRVVFGIAAAGETLFFTDDTGSTMLGSNRTCKIRAYNHSTESQSVFSALIPSTWVGDLAGNFAEGCAAWTPANENVAATDIGLRLPRYLSKAQDQLYFVATTDHCILRLSLTGAIETAIGLCGTQGDIVGNLGAGTARLRSPAGVSADPQYPQNLLIIDQSNVATGKLKYANFSGQDVTIMGVSVPTNEIKTIKSYSTYSLRLVAAFADQVCVGAGEFYVKANNHHGVVCSDRTTGVTSLIVNSNLTGVPIAGRPVDASQENTPAADARIYAPAALAFDEDGNLYISEFLSHLIRKVARWW